MLSDLVSRYAMATGKGRSIYRRICRPSGTEYADFLRRHGGFFAIGEDCYISPNANITDPAYVSLGKNVRISDCSISATTGRSTW